LAEEDDDDDEEDEEEEEEEEYTAWDGTVQKRPKARTGEKKKKKKVLATPCRTAPLVANLHRVRCVCQGGQAAHHAEQGAADSS
jgi:hypothetical protein